MTGKYFVDSNVLIYCFDSGAGTKQTRAEEWLRQLWENRIGALSVQVLNEFYFVVTQKLKPGLSAEIARKKVIDLFSWKPAALNEKIIQMTWDVMERYDFSFWDSMIVAAARDVGCEYLLTEDLNDGQMIGDMRVLNPFRHAPDSVN